MTSEIANFPPTMIPVTEPIVDSEGQLGESATYRHFSSEGGFPDLKEGRKSLFQVFKQSCEKYADNDAFGMREVDLKGNAGEYQWMKYKEAFEVVEKVGSALAHVGIESQHRVGIFGQNSTEWMLAMQGCNRQNAVCVPLYDTLGADAVDYIVEHSEQKLIFVAENKLTALVKALPKVKDQLLAIVVWPTATKSVPMEELKTAAGSVTVYTWVEFTALGASNPHPVNECKPEDLATFMYTSGTTGVPKGVQLTHSIVLIQIESINKAFESFGDKFTEEDVFISFLPLAHIFDRIVEEWFISIGAKIGYWQGNILKLMEDIACLRPTLFCGVPRVFSRLYSKITDGIANGGLIKRLLFNGSYATKLAFLQNGWSSDTAGPTLDKVVFAKVKAALGGRVKMIVSGGAPLPVHVEEFLKVVMCCRVVQGYGLTETCAASIVCVPDYWPMHGTIGICCPGVEMKLQSVPEMKYIASGAEGQEIRGEVCLRGPTVFTGYYKMPEKTAEDIDKDGWFHSGDIGHIVQTPSGPTLVIIDRKKNIFKLAQGEYVAVEHVESVYSKNHMVDQVWAYGNSLESCLVGLIVPNKDNLLSWAKANNLGDLNFEALCKNEECIANVLAEVTATAKEARLLGFEQLKQIHLEPEPFTPENDLVTPTFKLKRPALLKNFQSEIDALYVKANAPRS